MYLTIFARGGEASRGVIDSKSLKKIGVCRLTRRSLCAKTRDKISRKESKPGATPNVEELMPRIKNHFEAECKRSIWPREICFVLSPCRGSKVGPVRQDQSHDKSQIESCEHSTFDHGALIANSRKR